MISAPFSVGARVRIIPNLVGFHAMATSMEDIYCWLNPPGPAITGVVLRCEFWGAAWVVLFCPDGWPLPEGAWPNGSLISADRFEPLGEDVAPILAPIVTGRRQPVSVETLQARVDLHLKRQRPA